MPNVGAAVAAPALVWFGGGESHPVKRKKILDYLVKTKGDIILLQETKLANKEVGRINHNWFSQAICTPAINKKEGLSH